MGHCYPEEGNVFTEYKNNQEKIHNDIMLSKTLEQKLDNAIIRGINKQKRINKKEL